MKSKSGLLEGLLATALLLMFAGILHAQPGLPPRTITVTATQPIEFGAFVVTGSGGTITVDWHGVRSSIGGIVLVSASICKPAIFEVKLCPGRNVMITYSPTILLSNGSGGSLTLNIGPTEMGENGDVFIVTSDCNFYNAISCRRHTKYTIGQCSRRHLFGSIRHYFYTGIIIKLKQHTRLFGFSTGFILRLYFYAMLRSFMLISVLFILQPIKVVAQDMFTGETESPAFAYDKVPVTVYMEANLSFDIDVLLVENDSIYVNVEELFKKLAIPCMVSNNGNKLAGFIENENRALCIRF